MSMIRNKESMIMHSVFTRGFDDSQFTVVKYCSEQSQPLKLATFTITYTEYEFLL